MRYVILVVSMVVIAVSLSYGEMYKWMDEKGTVHFADDLSNVPEKYRSDAEMRKIPKEIVSFGSERRTSTSCHDENESIGRS